MNQRIVINVATDGSTEVRTEGFSGSSCRQASEFLERALGSKQSESAHRRLLQNGFNYRSQST